MNRVYLGLGSNIDPETNLPNAVLELQKYGRIAAVSRVWETKPVNCPGSPENFLNAAVLLETSLSAIAVRLEAIAAIESGLGRVRDPANRNAPRTIDIDVALFNDEILQIEHRPVPDPAIVKHAYLAIPLAELDPNFKHPQTGETLAEIAAGFDHETEGVFPSSHVDLETLLP
ncbi:2-amino-4-hydroxy-6-hydroxymethyldihydropteridine diphosphokinase [Thalassoroseus pseudoceratinae]|uniref:2-amino-4-hydroxy-6- hydroxymethyldihydropteridine diphosphokinase n=1 Tax=Thalassoroseus pseudoceratinae TaxID=2713176 RepID=UPI001422029B|nr:2-amino-4-hydroxy-6-hydroxymethyldihydropteridine diphosphokinase [Thalassoroseus pseudoceratinae]